MFQFGNDFAAFLTTFKFEIDLALYISAGGAVTAQLFQAFHTAFVAGATGFHAFAYPHFFLGMEFVKQAVLLGFGRQFLGFYFGVLGERARVAAHNAAVEFNNARGNRIQEAAVMGNHHEAAVEVLQQGFQPFNGLNVQVVGRLVQQQ